MYRHGGLDIFLAPKFQDRGLGKEVLRLGAKWLIEERGHHRLIIDPAASNARAIAAYESIGFKPVGIMRRYELGPDGDLARRAADGHARRGVHPQLSQRAVAVGPGDPAAVVRERHRVRRAGLEAEDRRALARDPGRAELRHGLAERRAARRART